MTNSSEEKAEFIIVAGDWDLEKFQRVLGTCYARCRKVKHRVANNTSSEGVNPGVYLNLEYIQVDKTFLLRFSC